MGHFTFKPPMSFPPVNFAEGLRSSLVGSCHWQREGGSAGVFWPTAGTLSSPPAIPPSPLPCISLGLVFNIPGRSKVEAVQRAAPLTAKLQWGRDSKASPLHSGSTEQQFHPQSKVISEPALALTRASPFQRALRSVKTWRQTGGKRKKGRKEKVFKGRG